MKQYNERSLWAKFISFTLDLVVPSLVNVDDLSLPSFFHTPYSLSHIKALCMNSRSQIESLRTLDSAKLAKCTNCESWNPLSSPLSDWSYDRTIERKKFKANENNNLGWKGFHDSGIVDFTSFIESRVCKASIWDLGFIHKASIWDLGLKCGRIVGEKRRFLGSRIV